MKLRDSGMPEEGWWESLLRPAEALERLGVCQIDGEAADFGCGYGTFTLPLASRTSGTVWAFDIDPLMVARTETRAAAAGVQVVVEERDLFTQGTGLADGSQAAVLIFNLLHGEEPHRLYREACRILRPAGELFVAHWRWDPRTPRGPALAIRPRPEQLVEWGRAAGFVPVTEAPVDLPPWHYGWHLRAPSS